MSPRARRRPTDDDEPHEAAPRLDRCGAREDLAGPDRPRLDPGATATGGNVELDLRPGGAYRVRATEEMLAFGAPELMIEGEVLEVDAPHRLVYDRLMCRFE